MEAGTIATISIIMNVVIGIFTVRNMTRTQKKDEFEALTQAYREMAEQAKNDKKEIKVELEAAVALHKSTLKEVESCRSERDLLRQELEAFKKKVMKK